MACLQDDQRSLNSLSKFTVYKALVLVPNNKFPLKQINFNFMGNRRVQEFSHSLAK